ncbi:MAG: hypothetical protein P1P82_17215 [Bacteroidales bacterium]|nr:hypothetical protein [Bacteroidales bacterium]
MFRKKDSFEEGSSSRTAVPIPGRVQYERFPGHTVAVSESTAFSTSFSTSFNTAGISG